MEKRTRPNLSISEIVEYQVQDSDVTIALSGATINTSTTGKIIYITSYSSTHEEDKRTEKSLIYRLPSIVGK